MSTQNKELLVLDGLNPVEIFQNGGLEPLLNRIETECRAVLLDVSTPNGRKEIASLAAKIAKSKTALDKMGKDLGEEWRLKVSAINNVRSKGWDRLESLQHEIRKPLTDFENAEKERIEKHEGRIRTIESMLLIVPGYDLVAINKNIESLVAMKSEDWQEFATRASAAIEKAAAHLELVLAESNKLVLQKAELERIQKLELERLQLEREARIAEEAAANAIKQAEDRIKQAELQAQNSARLEREKIEAEQKKLAEQQQAREQDTKHRAAVNNSAKEAISKAIYDADTTTIDDIAKAVTIAIAKGEVPNVTINY